MAGWVCGWCTAPNEDADHHCRTCDEPRLDQHQRATPVLRCAFALGRGTYCTEPYPHHPHNLRH